MPLHNYILRLHDFARIDGLNAKWKEALFPREQFNIVYISNGYM